MRRRPPTPNESVGSRSVSGTVMTPHSQRSGSGHGTTLVNLDVFIHRANIGHDISPTDEDLIVLFRRNSKEVTSEPAPWSIDHCAVWNQHVGIQTSLLRQKTPYPLGTATEFLKKEYEIVLVALPSHSAVALFSIDFASLVQLNASALDHHKSFRISPIKCRDLAATLELDITWELQTNAAANVMHSSAHSYSPGLNGLPPSSPLPGTTSQSILAQSSKSQALHTRDLSRSRRTVNDTMSVSIRRTNTSFSSAGSDRELLEELTSSNCNSCRSAKRRLDRKEVQVLQLESFLKESQKRIDALCTENDELIVREKAETRHAAQQRILTLRLLQELEATVQLCVDQMQIQGSTLLPQKELIERVKKLHEETDPLHEDSENFQRSHSSQASLGSTFDFRAETEAALQRNQRLQQQLEFLSRSMDYDNEHADDLTRYHRAATDASGTTISSAHSESVAVECEPRPIALTMTQQLNNLERENFKLRAELEGALANAARAFKKQAVGYQSSFSTALSLTAEISETASSSSRDDIDEPEIEDAGLLSRIREQHELEAGRSAALKSELEEAKNEINKLKSQLEKAQEERLAKEEKEPSQAPGFLDKIYADVGKAKLVLEDRVNQLDELLTSATDENGRLRSQIEDLQKQQNSNVDNVSIAKKDSYIADIERRLKEREDDIQTKTQELLECKQQLQDAATRARALESAELTLEKEVAALRRSQQIAREKKSVAPSPQSAGTTNAVDSINHNEGLAEIQKQLKLSKQEVMQLRFRSNQFESVNERLEEALKEKRTLEVKLTALEGQLFEQRSRTLNTDSSNFAASSLDAKSTAMLTDMQRELDHKAAQLMIAEREVEHLRGQLNDVEPSNPGTIEDLSDKVKQFENEIIRLCQRNDDQLKKLQKLGDRVRVAVRERDELEEIVQQIMTEMSLLDKDVQLTTEDSTDSMPSTPAVMEEMEEKSPISTETTVSKPLVQTGKITDRYANAVASSLSASHTPNPPPPSVTSNKVAQLMKNFSTSK
ncbi:uncharacterized protein PHALS_08323 [Plasmopara halstedii]|uniref:C2 NT-type domain-containing protein n=1 Tax=Plasmopara halstedii TaxID=4781 RepID=A0A0P1AD77_PLAHL|nr:uncharacterized protein PHALS_08323 [Plasmopara halstedii]CEG38237.1 hypothetical protein PHALS_08323 [Plasmopara halstedii]|eukprot:XP_024574606.1 hypothetical protein PHALS_08323 [Plasmopara halstedii]